MTVNMQLLYLFRTHIGKKSTNCNLQQWFLTTGSLATHIGNSVWRNTWAFKGQAISTYKSKSANKMHHIWLRIRGN